ncbi:hypothetical protein ONZ45_g4139 [Pleurotus djamor]|nr:hypothetical protein ONZ45_g4139 [Pleurotus djamor]
MSKEPLYSSLAEWADVQPLEQYENVNPVAPIFYSDEYKDATSYFRGIVKAGEMSPRVLDLTEHIIRLNPAHYTAWQYRYRTLMALKSPLDVELKLMDELAVEHLKTYQVWHHRRLILTESRNPEQELEFIEQSLKRDTKNYHTWSHRQWVLSYFNDDDLWRGELDFVDTMLNQDVRNNSAWHHRFFVVFQSGVREGESDRERVIKRELTYTKQNISLAPNNPSAWNYLRGVLDLTKTPYSTLETFVSLYTRPSDPDAVDIVDLDNPPPSKQAELPCTAAIEFLADVYEQEGKGSVTKATELWRSLADEHDTMRKNYWEYRIRESLA